MTSGIKPDSLKLTEEEAFALLGLCLTSPNRLDATSERALRKLAEYCSTKCNSIDTYRPGDSQSVCMQELNRAG
jgi:hypothetical protein